MNIPRIIAEKGGDVLKEYIALSMKLTDLENALEEVEASIVYGFTQINIYIEDYLPKRTGYARHYDDCHDLNCREIIPNVSEIDALNKIYMAEEFLSKIRGWILDKRVLLSKIKEIEFKKKDLIMS